MDFIQNIVNENCDETLKIGILEGIATYPSELENEFDEAQQIALDDLEEIKKSAELSTELKNIINAEE